MTFGEPQLTPTLRGTLQWLLVQMSQARAPVQWTQAAMTALQRRPDGESAETVITVRNLLSHRDNVGRVELAINDTIAQLEIPHAIEIAQGILGAAEAARVDQFMFGFARDELHLEPERAAQLVQASRVYREREAATAALTWRPIPPTEGDPTP
jgi:hypothetical protein